MNSTGYFPKVKEVRDALRNKALELYQKHLMLIDMAAASGEYEAALKASQWLIEHMPADENGERLIDPSASKPKEIESKQQSPSIQIGIQLGGLTQPKQLQPSIIDVTPIKDKNEK